MHYKKSMLGMDKQLLTVRNKTNENHMVIKEPYVAERRQKRHAHWKTQNLSESESDCRARRSPNRLLDPGALSPLRQIIASKGNAYDCAETIGGSPLTHWLGGHACGLQTFYPIWLVLLATLQEE